MYYYRTSYEIIGYAYEGDLHCVKCAERRFFNLDSYQIDKDLEGIDGEGNEIHPIFLGDEPGAPSVCGDCLEPLD